jgi:hypothetical protein
VSVDPRDDDGIFVKDAYAQFRVHRALRIRVGQFKIPGTREYDGSARRLDFLERSPLTESLAVRRDIGARADGRRGPIEYEFGLFAGDGVGRDERAGLTVAGRLAWQLNRDLQIGASVSDGRTEAVESDDPNGLQGRSPSGYRFLDGVYVQGQRVRVGGDIEWSPGPWRFVGEALQVRDERLEQGLDYEHLPSIIGTGASLSARRRFTARLEGALRYDYLGFDDTGGRESGRECPPTGRQSSRARKPRTDRRVDVGSESLDADPGERGARAIFRTTVGPGGREVRRVSDTRSSPPVGVAVVGGLCSAGYRRLRTG